MSEIDLVDCPFCGSDEITVEQAKKGWYSAICGNCEAEGPPAYTHKDARLAWKGRAAPPSPSTAPEVHERAAFEAWARDPIRAEKLPLDRWPTNDGYKDTRTYIAFYGWKSGRAALASRPAEVDDEGLPALPAASARAYVQNGYRRASVLSGPGEPLFTAEQFRQGQRDAVAADRARRGDGWISVEDRLPEVGTLVMVYSPPTKHDWPDALRIDFDYLDPDADESRWFNHGEHYEHFCCVAKPEGSVGPPEEAPYTHWRPVPAAPSHTTNKEK